MYSCTLIFVGMKSINSAQSSNPPPSLMHSILHKCFWEMNESVSSPPNYRLNNKLDWVPWPKKKNLIPNHGDGKIIYFPQKCMVFSDIIKTTVLSRDGLCSERLRHKKNTNIFFFTSFHHSFGFWLLVFLTDPVFSCSLT